MIAVFRTELKLLLRHWGVWISIAGSMFLAWDLDGLAASLPRSIDESVFRFYLLVPLLLTIAAARRHRSERVEELIGAMPYRPSHWVLGRYLANWVLWLLCSVPGWAMAGLSYTLRGEPVGIGTLALHWAVTAPITVLLITGVGFGLGHLPGSGLIGYVAAVAFYFGGVFIPMITDRSPRLPCLFLDFLPPQRWLPLNATGYFPNGLLVLMNRLFGLGLGVALAALVWAVLAHRRRLPVGIAALVVVLASAIALGGAVGSQAMLAAREQAFAAEEQQRLDPLASAVAATPVRADRYDLAVTFAPGSHRMAVTGSFTVTNGGTAALAQIDLMLRANFGVTSLTGPDGAAVPFLRAGDRLEIQRRLAPGESVRLTAAWDGEVWQWGSNRGYRMYQSRSVLAHVAPASIFLPADYGWYPLPGNLAPATFALTATGSDLNLISNAGGQVSGLFLIGTSLETITRDGAELTVSPASRERAMQIAVELAKQAPLLGETLAPPGQPLRVIEVPEGFADGLQVATERWLTPGAVLIRTYDFDWGGAFSNLPALSMRWWADRDRSTGLGLGGYMDYVVSGAEPELRWPGATEIMREMIDLEQARGREAALSVLRDRYIRP